MWYTGCMDESRIRVEYLFELADAHLRQARRLFFTDSTSLLSEVESLLTQSSSQIDEIIRLLSEVDLDSVEDPTV